MLKNPVALDRVTPVKLRYTLRSDPELQARAADTLTENLHISIDNNQETCFTYAFSVYQLLQEVYDYSETQQGYRWARELVRYTIECLKRAFPTAFYITTEQPQLSDLYIYLEHFCDVLDFLDLHFPPAIHHHPLFEVEGRAQSIAIDSAPVSPSAMRAVLQDKAPGAFVLRSTAPRFLLDIRSSHTTGLCVGISTVCFVAKGGHTFEELKRVLGEVAFRSSNPPLKVHELRAGPHAFTESELCHWFQHLRFAYLLNETFHTLHLAACITRNERDGDVIMMPYTFQNSTLVAILKECHGLMHFYYDEQELPDYVLDVLFRRRIVSLALRRWSNEYASHFRALGELHLKESWPVQVGSIHTACPKVHTLSLPLDRDLVQRSMAFFGVGSSSSSRHPHQWFPSGLQRLCLTHCREVEELSCTVVQYIASQVPALRALDLSHVEFECSPDHPTVGAIFTPFTALEVLALGPWHTLQQNHDWSWLKQCRALTRLRLPTLHWEDEDRASRHKMIERMFMHAPRLEYFECDWTRVLPLPVQLVEQHMTRLQAVGDIDRLPEFFQQLLIRPKAAHFQLSPQAIATVRALVPLRSATRFEPSGLQFRDAHARVNFLTRIEMSDELVDSLIE